MPFVCAPFLNLETIISITGLREAPRDRLWRLACANAVAVAVAGAVCARPATSVHERLFSQRQGPGPSAHILLPPACLCVLLACRPINMSLGCCPEAE